MNEIVSDPDTSFIVPKVIFLWRRVLYPDNMSGSTLRFRDWQTTPPTRISAGKTLPSGIPPYSNTSIALIRLNSPGPYLLFSPLPLARQAL